MACGGRLPGPRRKAQIFFAVGHDNPAAFARKVHLLWIGVGTEEPAQMHAGIARLHDSLTEANVKHVFYESPGTSHEWQTWRRDLKDFAPRLFQ